MSYINFPGFFKLLQKKVLPDENAADFIAVFCIRISTFNVTASYIQTSTAGHGKFYSMLKNAHKHLKIKGVTL